MIVTIVKLILKFFLIWIICQVVASIFGVCNGPNVADVITQFITNCFKALFNIIEYLGMFLLGIVDAIIALLWSNVPGLDDLVSPPKASELFG